jgi:hypothetical protein
VSPDGKSVAYLSQQTPVFAGNVSNLVVRSLDTGAERVGSIHISADGRRMIYGAGGPPTIEVWAIENLQAALKTSR